MAQRLHKIDKAKCILHCFNGLVMDDRNRPSVARIKAADSVFEDLYNVRKFISKLYRRPTESVIMNTLGILDIDDLFDSFSYDDYIEGLTILMDSMLELDDIKKEIKKVRKRYNRSSVKAIDKTRADKDEKRLIKLEDKYYKYRKKYKKAVKVIFSIGEIEKVKGGFRNSSRFKSLNSIIKSKKNKHEEDYFGINEFGYNFYGDDDDDYYDEERTSDIMENVMRRSGIISKSAPRSKRQDRRPKGPFDEIFRNHGFSNDYYDDEDDYEDDDYDDEDDYYDRPRNNRSRKQDELEGHDFINSILNNGFNPNERVSRNDNRRQTSRRQEPARRESSDDIASQVRDGVIEAMTAVMGKSNFSVDSIQSNPQNNVKKKSSIDLDNPTVEKYFIQVLDAIEYMKDDINQIKNDIYEDDDNEEVKYQVKVSNTINTVETNQFENIDNLDLDGYEDLTKAKSEEEFFDMMDRNCEKSKKEYFKIQSNIENDIENGIYNKSYSNIIDIYESNPEIIKYIENGEAVDELDKHKGEINDQVFRGRMQNDDSDNNEFEPCVEERTSGESYKSLQRRDAKLSYNNSNQPNRSVAGTAEDDREKLDVTRNGRCDEEKYVGSDRGIDDNVGGLTISDNEKIDILEDKSNNSTKPRSNKKRNTSTSETNKSRSKGKKTSTKESSGVITETDPNIIPKK